MQTAGELLDVLTAYQPAAAVAAAARTGVFDALDAPATVADLADRTGTVPGALAPLLEVLVSLGLVGAASSSDGARRFGATPLGATLRSDGELAPVVAKEALFARAWTDLDVTLSTGRPLLRPWSERLVTEPEVALEFLDALVTLAHLTGPDLTALPELGPGRAVVDVGGGLGSYAVPLARAGAHVTLVDLPPVAAWASQRLGAREAVAGSVVVQGADVLTEPACGVAPGSADAVLLAHLLHDLTDDQVTVVLREAGRALRPGGAVVVVEIPGDGPGVVGPLFDLMMQVETPGRARTEAELRRALADARMVDVQAAPYPRPVLVLTGRRA